ncbi:hypothetical protein [Pinibacter aurantiacus]|uniref:Uncharacterized protein n=1 Tax=Pinibacter aurantiacus TaxID=2851599 RepID=A0A9E2SBU2_9BACT|nr:hypothetical protein [Pinibacter aurantiacus]MBV4358513.1 hypothetical protein [Pinibacter aurantiacus]
MKTIIATILLSLSLGILHAQISVTNNAITGIDQFNLGDTIAKFENGLRPIQSLDKGHKGYQYQPALKNPIKIAGLEFITVLLSFDSTNKLKMVSFMKFYHKSSNSTKDSNKEYKILTSYITNTLNTKGDKKINIKGTHQIGRTWQRNTTFLSLETEEKPINNTYVEIRLGDKS